MPDDRKDMPQTSTQHEQGEPKKDNPDVQRQGQQQQDQERRMPDQDPKRQGMPGQDQGGQKIRTPGEGIGE